MQDAYNLVVINRKQLAKDLRHYRRQLKMDLSALTPKGRADLISFMERQIERLREEAKEWPRLTKAAFEALAMRVDAEAADLWVGGPDDEFDRVSNLRSDMRSWADDLRDATRQLSR